MHILLFLALLFMVTSCYGHSSRDLVNHCLPLDGLLDSLNIEPGMIYLHVDKSDFILSIMADTLVIKQYPVVLGGNPVDDKLRQGDECTPEGHFSVRTKYPHKSWDKFIWIDYPNEDSWEKHRKAKKEGIIEEYKKIGGEIGIHGVPGGTDEIIDLGMNWTLGCISLKNLDVNDFYPFVHKGTVVIIQK
ncbi:MAG: L,D-transpeptidase [Bacteroidales bacterium]|nr:L,D-transpeptidase [Bacteroidales bacterium]